MIEIIAIAILGAYHSHTYSLEKGTVYDGKQIIFEGTEEAALRYFEGTVSEVYAKAALKAMLKASPAMLWARSKGYEAMIEAGLKDD